MCHKQHNYMEELQEQYDNLKYFTQDLTIEDTEAWKLAKTEPELLSQLLLEMLFVNKLQTIGRWYEYMEQHKDESEFQRNLFYNKITKTKILGPFGEVDGFGIGMNEEEFEKYKLFYDSIFETTII